VVPRGAPLFGRARLILEIPSLAALRRDMDQMAVSADAVLDQGEVQQRP
jgi:hypothetical protein